MNSIVRRTIKIKELPDFCTCNGKLVHFKSYPKGIEIYHCKRCPKVYKLEK